MRAQRAKISNLKFKGIPNSFFCINGTVNLQEIKDWQVFYTRRGW